MSSSTQLDANQVIKTVYDDAAKAFTTIPDYIPNTPLWTAITAATTVTSTPVNITAYKVAGVVVSWTGLNHVDGTIQFQGSVDGTNYDNIGSATTLATAAGHQSFSLVDEPYSFFQIVYTHGTNTTGTLTASYMLRA